MEHDADKPMQDPEGDSVDPRLQALQWIRDDLAAMPIEDGGDACLYLAKAARLRVLGDPSFFDGWERHPRLKGHDLVKGLRERARVGRWDLRYADGMLLGRALIDASDFHILRLVDAERGGLLVEASRSLQAWAEDAEEAVLDDEAADEIRNFSDLYPIPERYRLEVMHEPLGDFERSVLAALPAAPSVELRPLVHEPEFALDRGRPTPRMMAKISDRIGRIDFPEGRWLSVSAELSPEWMLSLLIEVAEGDPSLLDHVVAARVGGFALERLNGSGESGSEDRHGDDPMVVRWSIDLKRLDVHARSQALNQTLGIALADGRRFRL